MEKPLTNEVLSLGRFVFENCADAIMFDNKASCRRLFFFNFEFFFILLLQVDHSSQAAAKPRSLWNLFQ